MNRSINVNMKMFKFFKTSIRFLYFTLFFLIIFSQNDEITLLVNQQLSRIRRIEFYREKSKKIELNKFCRFNLIKFTYFSTSSRLIIVLMIMIHSFQSSYSLKIKFVFEIVELMMKNIFDIVLIWKLMKQQKIK